jgi:rhodanese-related sulfurtransferase
LAQSISAQQFKALLHSKNPHILDIRTDAEYEDFNFGGLHIPFEELLQKPEAIAQLKHKKAIIICYTGLQSEVARVILAKKGYKKLFNLEGGIEAYLGL